MAEAFLDSSVLIGLVFRHAGERAACRAAIPPEARACSSRYVVFEVARGFLRSLIALHNYSLEFDCFADLHVAAHSGQRRFQPYAMHTWLGAFDDYFAALDAEDGVTSEHFKLEELRSKLRGWVRRGWQRLHADFELTNEIGCRGDLPAPALRGDARMDQRLPDGECGQPTACRLQGFVFVHKAAMQNVILGLEALPDPLKDKETRLRIDALRHLLAAAPGSPFKGRECHRSGDALICLEVPERLCIVTKNRKHFEPLARILNRRLTIAETARSTAP